MNLQLDFIISIIASIIGGIILGYLIAIKKHIDIFLSFGSIRKIWMPFLKGDNAIIITGRQGVLRRSTIKNSYSELLGIIILRDFFSPFNCSFKTYNSKMEIDTKRLYQDHNIILLGSQNANPDTKEISEKMVAPFSYDNLGNLVIRGITYSSKPSDGSPLKEDYAIIVKCNNPYNEKKKIMILAGNHGCATEAAVRFVTSKTGISKIGKKIGDSDFLAIIKVKMSNNIPNRCDLVDCWKFAEVRN